MNDISLGSLLNESPIKKSSTSDLQSTNVTSSSSSSSSSISSSLNLNNLFNDWSRDSSTSRMDVSMLNSIDKEFLALPRYQIQVLLIDNSEFCNVLVCSSYIYHD